MPRKYDLLGKKFGRLTVYAVCYNKRGKRAWKCLCDCGNENIVETAELIRGKSTSCGCYRKEKNLNIVTTHGMTNTRLFHIFDSMKARCYRKKSINYNLYGGRGIKICDEWLNDNKKFFEWAFKNGYKEDLTIDRIDVNGNYEPSNCRWITVKEQARNRRTNTMFTYKGQTKCLKEWGEITGLCPATIGYRIKHNYPKDKVLSNEKHIKVNRRTK